MLSNVIILDVTFNILAKQEQTFACFQNPESAKATKKLVTTKDHNLSNLEIFPVNQTWHPGVLRVRENVLIHKLNKDP